MRKFTGRFQLRIYDEAQSGSNIIKHITFEPVNYPSYTVFPEYLKLPEERKKAGAKDVYANLYEINKCLGKMDKEEVRRRRLEYNLCVKVSN